jgi:hypothetical protein
MHEFDVASAAIYVVICSNVMYVSTTAMDVASAAIDVASTAIVDWHALLQ